jgi:glycosyltransferase involved in cell wall biosynthesis
LDLIGEGINRKPLESAIKELGLQDQVRILGCRSDVRSILPQYKTYVHSSIRESLCLAIIEAMGRGLSVIAGAVGGIPELFEPGTEGLFWPLDNPETAAEILISLMENDAMRARLGSAAKARFEREFDAETVGMVLERFLESAVRADLPEPARRARNTA